MSSQNHPSQSPHGHHAQHAVHPHYGTGVPIERPSKRNRSTILWIIVGAGVIIAGGLLGLVFATGLFGDETAGGAPAPTKLAATASEDQEPSEDEFAPVQLGELDISGGPIVVEQGFGIGEVVVDRAEVIDDYGGILSDEDDVFLFVDFTWTTITGEESSANRNYFSVVDANGDEMELDVYYLEDDRLVAERVANGDSITVRLSFIVTDSTMPFTLTVESLTGAESEVITLG